MACHKRATPEWVEPWTMANEALERQMEQREQVLAVVERRGARKLRVFGSVAGGETARRATSICWWTATKACRCSASSVSGTS